MNVPVQTNVWQSQHTRGARTNKKQHETTTTQESQTNPPKQKPSHANQPNQNNKGEGQKHQPGQRTTRQAGKTKHSEGAGGSRQAETHKQERADAREGSRGRKEKAAQAKVGAYAFSGVQRDFGSPEANTSAPQRGAHEQHPQHGGEGKAHTAAAAQNRKDVVDR